jgi:hypothetical protein
MSGGQVQARLERLYSSPREVIAEARRTAGTE